MNRIINNHQIRDSLLVSAKNQRKSVQNDNTSINSQKPILQQGYFLT
jgi:hypothetical protein